MEYPDLCVYLRLRNGDYIQIATLPPAAEHQPYLQQWAAFMDGHHLWLITDRHVQNRLHVGKQVD